MKFFLQMAIFALIKTINAPSKPQITPKMRAIGIIVHSGDLTTVLPNFRASVDIVAIFSSHFISLAVYVSVNIQKVLAKNDLQTIGKVQN